MRPRIDGILESSLYVSDLDRSVRFYEEIFDFPVIMDFRERGCALQAGPRQVLLLFKKGASRNIPSPHDGDGELHLAFAISAGEFAEWDPKLAQKRARIEVRCAHLPDARALDLLGQIHDQLAHQEIDVEVIVRNDEIG